MRSQPCTIPSPVPLRPEACAACALPIPDAAVAEIVIVWSNSSPPDPEVEFPGLPVRIRNESTNSLNNRFRPDPDIRTRAILQLDDDIIIR